MAKRFIYKRDAFRLGQEKNRIYISTDLDKIRAVDKYAEDLIGVYGVIDTEDGCKLVEMDFAYDGHPIMMRTFLHEDYFLKYYENLEKVYL